MLCVHRKSNEGFGCGVGGDGGFASSLGGSKSLFQHGEPGEG